jgi:hypothetical protein
VLLLLLLLLTLTGLAYCPKKKVKVSALVDVFPV